VQKVGFSSPSASLPGSSAHKLSKLRAWLEGCKPPALAKQKEIENYWAWLLGDDVLTFIRTPWVIGRFLRGWKMDIPGRHPLGTDPKSFLDSLRPQNRQKLEEVIVALQGVKAQVALKVKLRKDRPDGNRS